MSFPRVEGFVVTEKLGSGSYSTVYKAFTKVGARSVVAIKCIAKSHIKQSISSIDNLVTEIRLLKALRHEHIVEMKEFTWDEKNIYIIMEYCNGGDMSQYIRKHGRLPEQQVLYFMQQLVSALKFLREKGVAHMDLKPHNLLLQKREYYTLKLADFGFAQYMSEDSPNESSIRGSPLYMAPEMITGAGRCDARVDLWSLGVILYECLFGKAPYSSPTFKQVIEKVRNKQPIELPPASSVSPGCQDLLLRLLQHDPVSRISYEELFQHSYLDLEHMPTKQNYEKGLVLAKDAIRAETAADYRTAFRLYRDALGYLVPVAKSHYKQQFRAQVNEYLQRAEQLKELISDTDSAQCGSKSCNSRENEERVPNIQTAKSPSSVKEPLAKGSDLIRKDSNIKKQSVPAVEAIPGSTLDGAVKMVFGEGRKEANGDTTNPERCSLV